VDLAPTRSDPLQRFYRVIERATAPLDRLHADRLQCRRGCASCCVDDLTVFEVEAENIRLHHGELLTNGEPAPVGGCAFLDAEGGCRIYEQRPYVCRTQGYPLRWEDDESAGDGEAGVGEGGVVEFRDICPLNEVGAPIETLPARACWTLGPAESRLVRLQSAQGDPGRRIRLRSLFSKEAG